MMVATLTNDNELEKQVSSPEHSNGNGRSPFKQLLDEYEFPQPQRGDIIQGEIMRLEEDVVFVDVGSKRDAMVPYDEISQLDEEFLDDLDRGDEVPVYVTRTPVGDEPLLVSLEQGLKQEDWERAERLMDKDETIELKITNHNKGGLVGEYGRLQGFVPNSQIPELRQNRNKTYRQKYKIKQIDTTIPVKIIELNPKQERFVLSATAVRREQRQRQLRELQEGTVVEGTIVNLKKYGAFVDIGDGLTGLLHISKIAWQHLDHPADVLAQGDEIEVVVEKIDVDRERISLNRKELLPQPWEKFSETHDTGDLLEGEVTSILEYGAFVKVAPDVEGLLHQNEMNIPYGGSVNDILRVGETVLVRIVSIDSDRQRLSLSMRRVSMSEEIDWMSDKA
jgi:small subunit ribosomal protein S1